MCCAHNEQLVNLTKSKDIPELFVFFINRNKNEFTIELKLNENENKLSFSFRLLRLYNILLIF